jgi:hypothetical protein
MLILAESGGSAMSDYEYRNKTFDYAAAKPHQVARAGFCSWWPRILLFIRRYAVHLRRHGGDKPRTRELPSRMTSPAVTAPAIDSTPGRSYRSPSFS